MDKLRPTGQNLGRVFYFRYGHVRAVHFLCEGVKLPNLKLKTQPKQVFGSFPLVIALPGVTLPNLTTKQMNICQHFLVSSFVRMIINVQGIKGKYVGQCKTAK